MWRRLERFRGTLIGCDRGPQAPGAFGPSLTRADIRAGHDQNAGMIMRIDFRGRLVVIDAYAHLLAGSLAVQELQLG